MTPILVVQQDGEIVGANEPAVRLLGECAKCDPTARNAYGQTALHFAAQNGRVNTVHALLDSTIGREALEPLLSATSGGCTAAEKARPHTIHRHDVT